MFRKKLIFQTEDALPDPEELKYHFRRRILLITLFIGICLLGFPVFREIHPYLVAKTKARHFAEIVLDTRLLAAKEREPVALEIDAADPKRWIRSVHKKDAHCDGEATAEEVIQTEGVHWDLRYKTEQSQEVHSTTHLCFNPSLGLFADGVPLQHAELLISAYSDSDEKNRSAKILLSDGSAEINFLSE